ncbi:MAG: hypothetical protein K2P57_07070 [Burkholderiales bacterium]|nr:hypothetical protein [Burkholderiales bacterium]
MKLTEHALQRNFLLRGINRIHQLRLMRDSIPSGHLGQVFFMEKESITAIRIYQLVQV